MFDFLMGLLNWVFLIIGNLFMIVRIFEVEFVKFLSVIFDLELENFCMFIFFEIVLYVIF